MDFRYYDKITPSDKAKFDMLFHSAQRTLQRLERKLHCKYGERIPMTVLGELLKLGHILFQMTALWKKTGLY